MGKIASSPELKQAWSNLEKSWRELLPKRPRKTKLANKGHSATATDDAESAELNASQI